VDEEFDKIRFDIVEAFDVEEVRGMLDEQSHLVLCCQVDNGVKNILMDSGDKRSMERKCMCAILRASTTFIIQLVLGDAKVDGGESWVCKGGVFVEVLEVLGKFRSVVQDVAGVQGDADELGLLNFHFLKSVFEFVEFMAVVQAQCCAKNTFNYSAKKAFVLYVDVEIDWGLFVASMQRVRTGRYLKKMSRSSRNSMASSSRCSTLCMCCR
jgi:hypothetical protein